MPYTINLVIDANTFNTGSIKYNLTSTNTDSNGKIVPSILTQTSIATGTSTITLGSGNFANGTNKVHTYVLNLYYPDSGADQNAEQEKSLAAHINVTSSAVPVPTLLSNKILGASNANVTSVLTTPGKEVSTSGETVLASTADDYGTSYYYRGNVQNNYIIFANMCWRIVRVTGSGAIKLTLYNYNASSVSNPCSSAYDGTSAAFARYSGTTYTSAFNTNYNDNAYVGFMYGTAVSSTYALTHANTNKSTILTNLEAWYSTYLSSYASSLADTIWCNDKSISTTAVYGGTLGYGTNQTGYSTLARLAYNGSSLGAAYGTGPSLVCNSDSNGGKLSKYTVDDITNGNGNLTYPIGLLTADEIAFAGSAYNVSNNTYYLNKNASSNNWWSLSPSILDGGFADEFSVYSTGFLTLGIVNNGYGVRPAVSLVSTTKALGSGTSSDPYTIS